MECLGYNNTDRRGRTLPAGINEQCLSGCFPSTSALWHQGARSRQPITALAARSLRNGITELREVVAQSTARGKQRQTSAHFYVKASVGEKEDTFFEEITSLCQRQTLLFQRSCEQLRNLYDEDTDDGKREHEAVMRTMTAEVVFTQPSPSPFSEIESSDIEALYVDCLYAVLHMIGCDAEKDGQWQMVEQLRKAFRFDSAHHLQLFESASSLPPPQLGLDVTVTSARELPAKDALAASSDPFVTLALKNRQCSFSTSWKSRTLNPKWNESFVLSLGTLEDKTIVENEVLLVDVWNFSSSDEKFRERLRRINEVKDPRGLKQLVVSTIKKEHKLIGSVEIPIRSIPASGFNKWWTLEKGGGAPDKPQRRLSTASSSGSLLSLASNTSSVNLSSGRGELHLSLHLFTSSKSKTEVLIQHRRLLRVLLSHELLRRNSPPYTWRDDFQKETLQILAQHAVQGQMSREETALSRWFVYCEVHRLLPLDYRVFTPILEKLRKRIQGEEQEQCKEFHQAADNFATSSVAFVRKHRHYVCGSSQAKYRVQLENLLKCLHIIHCLRWRSRQDVALLVEEAVVHSLAQWADFLVKRTEETDKNIIERLRSQTRLAQLLAADLSASRDQFDEIFRETLNIDYGRLAFRAFEERLAHRAESIADEVCKRLGTVAFKGDEEVEVEAEDDKRDEDIALGTGLFEYYLAVLKFYSVSADVSSEDCQDHNGFSTGSDSGHESTSGDSVSSSAQFSSRRQRHHQWFLGAVAKWLDIALFKAMKRILKAVELDALTTVDDLVRFTTSAVDIRIVLSQIKTFWHQLQWPDSETSYAFISRIIDDSCQAVMFYADQMRAKVEQRLQEAVGDDREEEEDGEGQVVKEELFFSREQCLAVNNIDYVLKILHPFVQDLGISDVLSRLEASHGGLVADACQKTVKTLVKNASENVEHQILKILDDLSCRMAPTISFLLEESLSECIYGPARQSNHKLLHFLDEHLIFLKEWLDESNFDRALLVIWSTCANCLSQMIKRAIDDHLPVSYFAHLYNELRDLLNFFFGESGNLPSDDNGIGRMARDLRLYACSSQALVLHYYSLRVLHQQQHSFPYGSVTAKVLLQGRHLRVEVLSARHLKPVDSQAQSSTCSNVDLCERQQAPPDSCSSSSAYSSLLSSSSTFPRKARRRKATGNDLQLSPSTAALPLQKDLLPSQTSELEGGFIPGTLPSPYSTAQRDQLSNLSPHAPDGKLHFLMSKLDSVRLNLQEAHLSVHKNFSASGLCNPYVTVRVVPVIPTDGLKVKTKVQQRTLFPLFDETFDLILPDGTDVSSSFLNFCVKDKGVMGEGIFLGEAYLPLSQVVQHDIDRRLEDLPQTQLPLTRPRGQALLGELLFAIHTRSSSLRGGNAKAAKDFLRRERRKML